MLYDKGSYNMLPNPAIIEFSILKLVNSLIEVFT